MFLSVAKVIAAVLGFFYITYTSRYLGPTNYGILAFALALTGIFSVLANFGFDPLMIREVAKDKGSVSEFLANGLFLKTICGIVATLAIVLVSVLFIDSSTSKIVTCLMAFSIVLSAISNVFSNIYQAFQQLEYFSIGQIIHSALMLIFAVVGIYLDKSVIFFALNYVLSSLALLLFNITITTRNFARINFSIDYGFLKRTIKDAWPFALSAIFVSIFYWIDSIMLSFINGDTAVGHYNAAYNLMMYSLFIPIIFNTVVFPILAGYALKPVTDGLSRVSELYLRYMVILSVTLVTFMAIFAPQIIITIYGVQYAPSIGALQILIFSVAFVYLSSPFTRVLEVLNMQRLVMVITAFGACFNVIANIIVIPQYSFYGASITTVLTELIMLIAMALSVYRVGIRHSKRIPLTFIKVCASAGITFGVYYIISGSLGEITSILLLLCVYAATLLILRVPDDYDIELVQSILKGFKVRTILEHAVTLKRRKNQNEESEEI